MPTYVRYVNKIQFHFEKLPDAADVIYIGALRMLTPTWTATALDINTRNSAPRSHSRKDGGDPGMPFPVLRASLSRTTQSSGFPFDSGSGLDTDYIQVYARMREEDRLTQNTIDGTTQEDYNTDHQPEAGGLIALPREQSILDGLTQIKLELQPGNAPEDHGDHLWNLDRLPSTWGVLLRRLYIESTDRLTPLYVFDVDIENNTEYYLQMEFVETRLQVKVHELEEDGSVGDEVFSRNILNGFEFKRRKGSIAWTFQLEGDAYVDHVSSSGQNYGEFRSTYLQSWTPVRGAQLYAGAPSIKDLYEHFYGTGGANVVVDTTFSKSADGSWRVETDGTDGQGAMTNFAEFENFDDTFITFDMYLPDGVSAPSIALRNSQGKESPTNIAPRYREIYRAPDRASRRRSQ